MMEEKQPDQRPQPDQETGTEIDKTNEEQDDRVLSIRLPVDRYRVVRTIGVTRDLNNAEVVVWAIELLERHVAAGGAR